MKCDMQKRMTQLARRGLTEEHVREVVSIVATESLERRPDVISAREAITAKGVRITVNSVAHRADRVAHLVTLAADRSWMAALKLMTAELSRAFGVRAKILAE